MDLRLARQSLAKKKFGGPKRLSTLAESQLNTQIFQAVYNDRYQMFLSGGSMSMRFTMEYIRSPWKDWVKLDLVEILVLE